MFRYLTRLLSQDDGFIHMVEGVERLASKVLSLAMIGVIFVAIIDLGTFLIGELTTPPYVSFSSTLLQLFGLFLDVLIALEILENITAYLRKHAVQVELVIVTALTAVARKLIVFDFGKASGIELMGLAIATIALAGSYWIIRHTHKRDGTPPTC